MLLWSIKMGSLRKRKGFKCTCDEASLCNWELYSNFVLLLCSWYESKWTQMLQITNLRQFLTVKPFVLKSVRSILGFVFIWSSWCMHIQEEEQCNFYDKFPEIHYKELFHTVASKLWKPIPMQSNDSLWSRMRYWQDALSILKIKYESIFKH